MFFFSIALICALMCVCGCIAHTCHPMAIKFNDVKNSEKNCDKMFLYAYSGFAIGMKLFRFWFSFLHFKGAFFQRNAYTRIRLMAGNERDKVIVACVYECEIDRDRGEK